MIKHTERRTEHSAYTVFVGRWEEPVPFRDSRQKNTQKCLVSSTLRPMPTGHSTQAQGQREIRGHRFLLQMSCSAWQSLPLDTVSLTLVLEADA